MKGRSALSVVLLATTTVLLVVGMSVAPARAKGPAQAVIEGPGLSSPISLRVQGAKTIGPDLAAVVEKSGFFDTVWCPGCPDRPPEGELGPRYMVTYSIGDAPGEPSTILQHVYPYAKPRPVTFMLPDQRFYNERTSGGWHVADDGLRRTMIELGLPENPPPTGSGSTDRPPGTQGDAGVPTFSIAIAILAAAIAGGVILVWRRRHPATS